MAEPIVLFSHTPGEGHYKSDLYKVVPILCDTDLSYWKGVADNWDHPAPIINIEHDVEVTDINIAELLSCPHKLCSFLYTIHWASSGNPNDVYPMMNNGLSVQPGDEFAEWSAIGFVKITPEARIAPLAECHWRQMENAIDGAVQKPWHLHWGPDGRGVPHHHW